jgi:hypothetical protein
VTYHTLISAISNQPNMRSIIALALLLSFVLPCMALSPVEQAYVDGVNDGVKLGKLVGDATQYNIAAQEFNDKLNQTFGANASLMWLPMMAVDSAEDSAQVDSFSSAKPIHKMDGTPSETVVTQY